MDTIRLYHGGTDCIEKPDCMAGRDNLDFGRGFYLSDIYEQAEVWARKKGEERKLLPKVNVYELNRKGLLTEARCKIFKAYDEEWLAFIVASRSGLNPAAQYDYIEGGVANDRITDTVALYLAGLMDLKTALTRLSLHQPNNQICLLNQGLTDKYLVFHECRDLH